MNSLCSHTPLPPKKLQQFMRQPISHIFLPVPAQHFRTLDSLRRQFFSLLPGGKKFGNFSVLPPPVPKKSVEVPFPPSPMRGGVFCCYDKASPSLPLPPLNFIDQVNVIYADWLLFLPSKTRPGIATRSGGLKIVSCATKKLPNCVSVCENASIL